LSKNDSAAAAKTFLFFRRNAMKSNETKTLTPGQRIIQNTLVSLGIESSMSSANEWLKVLSQRGGCESPESARELLTKSVILSQQSGEPITRASESGKWIGLIVEERSKIARQSEIIRSEESERDRRRREESERIAHEASTLGARIKEAQRLIPLLEATLEDRAILWAGFAKKNPTPFILSNCRRLLRAHQSTTSMAG
jgi:hypothetical protein